MLNKTSEAFRAFIILQFTKELIKHTNPNKFKKIILTEKKEIKRPVQLFHTPLPQKIPKPKPLPLKRQPIRIPEPKLPPGLQYLKPTATQIQIDLGKLNPILKDPSVISVECNGPNEAIITRGPAGPKKTNIALNKEEIKEIVDKFSKTAKIPILEGVFKVAVGSLVLSAIISEVVGTKFIINKIMPSRPPTRFPPRKAPPIRGRF